MARVAAYTGRSLSTRRTGHVLFFMKPLARYPEPHNGNIVGLADKAMQWHRDVRAQELQSRLAALDPDAEPAKPPFLPRAPGVVFLDSVQAILREGHDMHHCVGEYASAAVDGECYLFHVEHLGARATVEVAADGTVTQAQGPHNTRNGAASWGSRVLAEWGRDLRVDA